MPKPLSALTDVYYEEPLPQALPVEQPFINIPNDIPRVVISNNVGTDNIVRPAPDYLNPPENNAVAKLTGATGERYQLWPEKIVREALTAAGDVMQTGTNLGLRREDYTDIPAPDMPTKDSTWLGKKLGIAPVAASPQDDIIEKAQAISALAGSGGLGGTGAEAGTALGVVPVDIAKKLNFKTGKHPDILKEAVDNTPNAFIDPDGHLVVGVKRSQHPDQEGAESVRGGVFYLPEGQKGYSYTGKNGYGGSQKIDGETAFKNPLVVKGATGGKAPERAYNELIGDKNAYENMRKEAIGGWGQSVSQRQAKVQGFLEKYAPELMDYADYIIQNSAKGNQLPYALQEAAVASAARKAGYDGIVGYSLKKDGKPFLSEVFDVRENRYPSTSGDYSLHPELYSDSKVGTAVQAVTRSGPYLRPALRYKDKLYKGKEGQQHLDVIPEQLYPDFQKKAMSGEDIKEYNFGFVNDKGQFLTREKALEYGINTGLIDPQAGKYGALTSTLMADSSKPGTAIEAVGKMGGADPRHFQSVEAAKFRLGQLQRDKAHTKKAGEDVDSSDYMFYNTQIRALKNYIKDPETFLKADSSKEGAALQANKPTFYSAVEHNVNAIPQAKMTGEQWLGTLANKPGVKGEELDWTGLKGFLEENKGKPVTKEQINEHLASNKVELKEVSKGDLKFDKNSEYALPEVVKAARQAGDTPGDLELTLANDGKAYEALMKKFPKLREDEDWAATVSKAVFGGDSIPTGTTKYHSYQLPGGNNYREMLLTLPPSGKKISFDEWYKQTNIQDFDKLSPKAQELAKAKYEKEGQNVVNTANYRSSHWDEPNILAHVRMNDRTIDGKKSLGILEAQSDWHQAGRKAGYKGEVATKKYNELIEKKGPAADELNAIRKQLADDVFKNYGQGYDRKSLTSEQQKYLGDKLNEAKANNKEFQEKNKAFNDIQAEIEKGNPNMGVPDAPFKKTWHELAIKRMIREAAEKGYDNLHFPGSPETVAKVEGWTNFKKKTVDGKERYFTGDQDVTPIIDRYLVDFPRFLNKLGKEHGVKVQQHKFNIREKGAAPSDFSEGVLNNIDIPASMKATALNKGFPLFSKGGFMLQPVDYDPFSDNK